MQFLAIQVGSRELAFPNETSIEASFTFPQPVRRVSCMLQGFDLAYPDGDHELLALRIEPRVEFDELVSTTTGQLRVQFIFRDDADGIWSARTATYFARLLLLGE